jgi:hypothetical protein
MKFKPRFLKPLNERAKPAPLAGKFTADDKAAAQSVIDADHAEAERLAAIDAAADTVIAEVTTPTGKEPKGKGRKGKKVPEGTGE